METFPPQNQVHFVTSNGINTNIVCTTYSDRHFILITQIKKIGTLIKVTSEEKIGGGRLYHVDVIMVKKNSTSTMIE